jgi:hypothetical protein
LRHWPEYLAFAISFFYIGVIWLNHHALFAGIRRVDVKACYEPGHSSPAACWRKTQANATK